MKTKRIMLTAVLTLIGAGTAVAIPADPAPKKVRQADGTEKTVYLFAVLLLFAVLYTRSRAAILLTSAGVTSRSSNSS